MLDNEPDSGDRAGTTPESGTNSDAADNINAPETLPTAIERPSSETEPAPAPAESVQVPPDDLAGQDQEAAAEAADLGEVPAVAVTASETGTEDGTAKSPRRRRRATAAPAVGEAEPGQAAGGIPAESGEAESATARTRRRTVAAQEPETVESVAGPTSPPMVVPGRADFSQAVEPDEDEVPDRRRRAALTPPTVLFMAPEPEVVPVRRRVIVEPAVAEPEEGAAGEAGEPTETRRRRRRAGTTREEAEVAPAVEDEAEPVEEEAGEIEEAAEPRRRRRRGRRGRGRGKGTVEETDGEEPIAAESDEAVDEEVEAVEVEATEDEEVDGTGSTRRRRRRRRRGTADVDVEVTEDGVETVVKIREPRRAVDEVQGVSGSTRLEAKRQRRRGGREQRRTRPPILSEAEFLARREAVDRVMVIRQRGDRSQIAVLEDGVLVEHYVSRATSGTMAGNVYLGRVQNVLPSMEAAFVDIGRGRNAVLYAGEVNWDATGLEGRARSIEQALKSGDTVLVQVTKDPIGHKGARLTSHIALSGRHLVYVPHGNASGISRKLPDNERRRLREILKKLVPDGAGVIVRTAAEGASEDELARDIKRLQAQWEDIQAKAAGGSAPALLYEEPDLVIRVVRDLFNEDFRELVVQGDDAYDMVESYLAHVSPDLVSRLRRYTGVGDVFAEQRIDEQLIKALDRKVYLPSGGHLVIDRTEAMTVIDVNTGKYTGAGGNLEETVTRNNLEAAEEIVRQLRLRDVGGIIVIDFIDMVLESNRELVLRRLTECLGRDRTKHQVTEITSLGLVQMTRKRIGAGLLEAFSETCQCCKGRGVIIHTEPLTDKPRSGAGDKVKAVASATSSAAEPAAQGTASTGGGRRSRRRNGQAAGNEPTGPVAPAEAAKPPAASAAIESDDTMGYDLSRYEEPVADPAELVADHAEPRQTSFVASADDPDAI